MKVVNSNLEGVPARLTLDDCRAVAAAHGGVCLSDTYENSYAQRLHWRCAQGHEWDAIFGNIRKGQAWCRVCAGFCRFDRARLEAVAAKRGLIYLGPDLVGALERVSWRCVAAGHEFEARPAYVDNKNGCAACYGNVRRTHQEAVAFLAGKGFLWVSGQYVNNKSKMTVRCPKGHEFTTRFISIYHDHGCVRCVPGRSKFSQNCAFEIVKAVCLDAQQEVRGLLPSKRLELDIWVPSRRLAFEWDGWWHFWGRHGRLTEPRETDTRKDRECVEVGIRLVRLSGFDLRRVRGRQKLKDRILQELVV